LLLDHAGEVELGTPFVEGARVVAEVLEQGRDPKILVLKYKNKTRYRRRRGHRQAYTRIAVREILTDGRRGAEAEAEKPASRPHRRKAVEKKVKPPAEARRISESVSSPTATEATIADAPAAPRAARARKAPKLSTEMAAESLDAKDTKTARRTRPKKVETGD
jgi:large subunit ribosomal protein L21